LGNSRFYAKIEDMTDQRREPKPLGSSTIQREE
jgi:hypothetical protein